MSGAADRAKQIQKVYSEWCIKAAEIILASRVDSPGTAEAPVQTSASFNLKVPELFDVRGEAIARSEFFQLKTQRSFQVEIYLATSAEDEGDDEVGELLERWTFTFFPANPEAAVSPERCNQTLVRKLSVTLRSLMCFTRLLPAYALCNAARGAGNRRWRFRVEAWPPTCRATPAQELATQDFVSLQSSVGALRLSVAQRKDMKALSSAAMPFRGITAFSSKTDPIEVHEGYFGDAAAVADSGGTLGRLDKIAEEPEAKALDARRCGLGSGGAADGSEPPALSTTPCTSNTAGIPACGVRSTTPCTSNTEPSCARLERHQRPRLSSEDSTASTAWSTSSRTRSLPDHAVILGSTPPLAAVVGIGAEPPPGLLTLGPQRGSSACSSRSHTPQSTPKLGPSPEPAAGLAGADRSRPSTPGNAPQSQADSRKHCWERAAHSPNALAGAGAGPESQPMGAGAGTAPRPGELEDLSNIWMSCPPEWGRRRSTSLGTASRGTRSRSPSLEDATRMPGSPPAWACEDPLGALTTGGGEICMFGMSDDEDRTFSEDEDGDEQLERNVVASTIQQGGGAFAGASGSVNPERLGLLGLEAEVEGGAARPGRRSGSEASSSSPLLSPLIAQLNPFMPPTLRLDLPPLDTRGYVPGSVAHGDGDEAMAVGGGGPGDAAAGDGGTSEARLDVHHLLVEMGDLVCRLQQRQPLALTSQEVAPEELLSQLGRFGQLAGGWERRRRA